MATKLNVNTGGEDIGKKLWERHQKDEYTHVDHYKEALCINCFKKDTAAATIDQWQVLWLMLFLWRSQI